MNSVTNPSSFPMHREAMFISWLRQMLISGPPRLARHPRPRPCLDFAEYIESGGGTPLMWRPLSCGGLANQKLAVAALNIDKHC